MATASEPENVWTDEMLDAAIAADAAARRTNWKPVGTGLVSYAGKSPTKDRSYVTKCPECFKATTVQWLPDLERFQFDCTRPHCNYTKRVSRARYSAMLAEMSDADGKPIPRSSVFLPRSS